MLIVEYHVEERGGGWYAVIHVDAAPFATRGPYRERAAAEAKARNLERALRERYTSRR